MKRLSLTLLVVTICFLTLVLLGSLCSPEIVLPAPGRVLRQMENLVFIRELLSSYTNTHEGKLPDSLSEVFIKASNPQKLAEAKQFHDPATGETSVWIYFKGCTKMPDGDHSEDKTIVIASEPYSYKKGSDKDYRIVMYRDFSIRAKLKESVFEEELRAQGISMNGKP